MTAGYKQILFAMHKAATATASHPAKGQSQRSTRGAAAGLLPAGLLSSKPGKSGKSIDSSPKALSRPLKAGVCGQWLVGKTNWFPAARSATGIGQKLLSGAQTRGRLMTRAATQLCH